MNNIVKHSNIAIYVIVAVITLAVGFIFFRSYPNLKERFSEKSNDSESLSGSESKLSSSSDFENVETNQTIKTDVTNESDTDIDTTDTVPDVRTEKVTDIKSSQDNRPPEEGVGYTDMSEVLFIGDSRTVGIRDYSDIKEADFFATTGMSVFNIHNETVNVKNVGNIKLVDLLEKVKYKKIYLMLGINELGYNMDAVFKKYVELLEEIKKFQPDATIYLGANLHVVRSESETSNIYNNEKINKLNDRISSLADNKKTFYIDVNPLFDDKDGNLNDKYASGGSHLIGSYYKTWGEWLRKR